MNMDKSKVLAMIIGVLILCEGFGVIYFASRTQALSRRNAEMIAGTKGAQPRDTPICPEIEGAGPKCEDMSKELESVKKDRENILAQTRSLLASRMRAQELEEELNKVKASVQTVEDARQKARDQNLALKAHIKKLKEDQAQLSAERDELKTAYEKAKKNVLVKELNDKIAGLQKELKSSIAAANTEKSKGESDLKASEKKVAQLAGENSKLAALKEQLTAKVQEQEVNYAEAVRKNKAFEQEIRAMPGKFVEVSRQNKALLKQTAGMHYNLGVFYTRHKDYDRAAAEFAKAVEINPDDAYAHFNLGYIYAEYLINRHKAMDHFRHFLRLAKGDDPDVNWARKYLLTWETYDGKRPIQ